MEEEKVMMVAKDLIKETPPAVPLCCQKKKNGLSELDFSLRNPSTAKPKCIIFSTDTQEDTEDDGIERVKEKDQLFETKGSPKCDCEEMEPIIHNLCLLLKQTFHQLQEEKKHSKKLLNQVIALESEVVTNSQILSNILKQAQTSDENQTINNTTLNLLKDQGTKSMSMKNRQKTLSSVAEVVLSSVKMKHAADRHTETAKSMKHVQAEHSFLSTCGDTFNSKALDMEDELDMEGRPSRFSKILSHSSDTSDCLSNPGTQKVEEYRPNQCKRWRRTGMKILSKDFRDSF